MKRKTTETEENYLKAIYKLSGLTEKSVSTNEISGEIETSAASVTDMLKKLKEKGLTIYEKYKGVRLSKEGRTVATALIRKHRLWEVFLFENLNYSWDEVHAIAEQLEHIKSDTLIDRLDTFLGTPKFDPHGDPIPDKNGKIEERNRVTISSLEQGESGVVVGVQLHSTQFLRFLDKMDLVLGTKIIVVEKFEFDNSMKVKIIGSGEEILSSKVNQNLFVEKI